MPKARRQVAASCSCPAGSYDYPQAAHEQYCSLATPLATAFSALRQAAAEIASSATGSGQEGFVRVPQELLWKLNGALEADGRVTRRDVREFFGRYLLDREPHSTLDDVADAAVLLLGVTYE